MYLIMLYVAVLISAFCMVWLVYSSKKNTILLNALISFLLVISNVGYLMIAMSGSLEAALVGNAVSYIGNVFLPFVLMLVLSNLSNTKLPNWILACMMVINSAIYFTVLSANTSDLFYSNKAYVLDIAGRLVTQPGPFYYVRLVMLAIEVALSIFFVVQTLIGRKDASRRTMLMFIGIMVAACFVYSFEKIFNTNYQLIPFFYAICSICVLVFTSRVQLYDVSSNVENKLSEQSGFGYINFDEYFNYVGSNTIARRIFPVLETTFIDDKIKTDDYNLKEIIRWVKKESNNLNNDGSGIQREFYVVTEGNEKRHLRCELSPILFGVKKRIIGYMLELVDDTTQNEYIRELNYEGSRYKREADRQIRRNKTLQNSTILGMASMIESRDNSTGGHINRTSSCVALFVDEIKKSGKYSKSDNYWECVVNAAPLHDLGKIAVDDAILRKPAAFTEDEYKKMKTHAAQGARIVSHVLCDVDDREFIKVAENVAHYHHEKFDGSGYPNHLRREDIPLEARIMAIADVFDALASKRYYKEAMTYEQAFKVIKDASGTHFDPELTQAFLSLKPKIVELYDSFDDTEYHR